MREISCEHIRDTCSVNQMSDLARITLKLVGKADERLTYTSPGRSRKTRGVTGPV